MNTLLKLAFTLVTLTANITAAAPVPRLPNGGGKGRIIRNPGRVITKTYTYDSTRDPYDPCNPVTGDHLKCLATMADDFYPTYNPPTGDVVTETAYANSFATARGSPYDTIYSRPPKTSEVKKEHGKSYEPLQFSDLN